MRNLIRVFSIIGLLLLSGCGLLPSRALPIEGWVVDAETKQPLEGVIVRVQWDRYTSNGFHQTGSAPFLLKEDVTDQNGHFSFPEWEQRVPGGILTSSLGWTSPRLIFVKEGYNVLRESNTAGVARHDSRFALKSKWHGKVIPLAKPKTQKEYEEDILWLGNSDVQHITNLGCMWKNIPRTLAFLYKTNIQLFGNARFTSSPGRFETVLTIEDLVEITTDRCGDPCIFLEEYLK